MSVEPAATAPDALHRELTQERIQSARRVNLVRLWGVSAFFALFLVLGGVLRLPAWTGNLGLFAIYWAVSVAVFWASRRSERIARHATLAVPLLDVPVVFFLQWATFPTSPSASGVAGFTVGIYVLLVILAALSLENWYILVTAAVGAAFEVLLQHLAGVSVGAMVSTVILLGLAAAACSYARRRLVDLVGRVDRELGEQRRTEQALRQAERMASLGTLAAGVAHEVNTPLTYVVTNLALIAERLPALTRGGGASGSTPADLTPRLAEIDALLVTLREGFARTADRFGERLSAELRHDFNSLRLILVLGLNRVEEELAALAGVMREATQGAVPAAGGLALQRVERLLEQARDGAERVRLIVRDLKVFSRPDEESLAPVDLREALRSAINLTANEIHHRARLRVEGGAVPLVMANQARLGQVFVNLLLNAAQAIPEGAADRNEISVVTRTDESGRAVVEVHDTGSGIAPEPLRHLFDPFFTTKPVGEGTGLGLSICHGIVSSLGGELSVENAPAGGSTFRVVLPPAAAQGALGAAVQAPLTTRAPALAVGTPPRRGRLLVIDDDAGIVDLVGAALEAEHEVVGVTSATDALGRIERGEHFDLILCDLMMPVMTGMDLHEELARRDPAHAATMVFLTGGAFTPRAQAFVAEMANGRLDKPFDARGLRSFVRERLALASSFRESGARP